MQGKKVCDQYCKGCIYLGKLCGGCIDYCKYILVEGKRRPCPPGKDCTVKQTRKIRKNAKVLTINGITKCVPDWAEAIGAKKNTIYYWYRMHGKNRTEQMVLEALRKDY